MKQPDLGIVEGRLGGAGALDRGPGAPQVASLVVSEALRDTLTLLMTALVEDVIERSAEPRAIGSCASPPLPRSSRLVARYGSTARCGAGPAMPHAGLDFAAPRGAPVLAVRPGVVEHTQHDPALGARTSGYGKTVVIYHYDEDLVTVYSHLADIDVATGVYVEAGQPIGALGSSQGGQGLGLGVHLHLEVCCRGPYGESPFPWDPGHAHRTDPEPWLRSHGIVFNRCGVLVEPAGR
jgi:murein DD-endopeptidase MepM/ murein hydrolase activator NlpD